jgi:hypothetical protein
MFNRRTLFACVAVAAGSLAMLPGCDWLSGSDPGARQSPTISTLSISPSSVLCDTEFTVSFHFDDPQGDVKLARVTITRQGDTFGREESPSWPSTASRSSGTVSFPFKFPCSGERGNYTITVLAEDEREHKSNELVGEVRFN